MQLFLQKIASESRELTEADLQNSLTGKLTGSQLEGYDSFSSCVVAQALEGEGTRELLVSGWCE